MYSIQNVRLISILPFGKRYVNIFNSGQYRTFSNTEKKEVQLTSIPIVSPNKLKLIKQRIIIELKHYYNGSKLLYFETKIALRILHKLLNGHTLTRRERKQLSRTIIDLFRLIPFSVFIIVPFMEFTLPIFLKFFPNMLPSTFKNTDQENENLKKREIIKFLEETRESYSNDALTLDKLNRLQLIALCKLLNLSFIGPNYYLRFKLQLKFRRLQLDDKLITQEGIDNLNFEELQIACHERGINSINVSIEHLKSQLEQWLDLHINKQIPLTSLLLSKRLYLSEILPKVDISGKCVDTTLLNEDQISRYIQEEKKKDFYINQVEIPLEQLINQKVIEEFQVINKRSNYVPSLQSDKTDSTCMNKILIQLSQTFDHRQEIRK